MTPPIKAITFLRWFCRKDYIEEIEGDLTEIFENESVNSLRKAKWKFVWSVIKYFRPQFLKPLQKYYQLISFGMYKNYLIIAWRNLLKKKGYSTINILGLALGIACCLLIVMYVYYERSFDNYHAKGDRIYRVIHGWKDDKNAQSNSTESYWVWGNAPIGQALHDNFPEIDKVVQFSGRAAILFTLGEKTYQEEGLFFIASTAFDVFSW